MPERQLSKASASLLHWRTGAMQEGGHEQMDTLANWTAFSFLHKSSLDFDSKCSKLPECQINLLQIYKYKNTRDFKICNSLMNLCYYVLALSWIYERLHYYWILNTFLCCQLVWRTTRRACGSPNQGKITSILGCIFVFTLTLEEIRCLLYPAPRVTEQIFDVCKQ